MASISLNEMPGREKSGEGCKTQATIVQSQVEAGDTSSITYEDWTKSEETAIVRRIDFIMLPLLGVTFFSLQLDRGNIGVALSGGIAESLKISTNQINIGVQLMYLGVVLLEVPSNIVLQRIGPHKWLSSQILAWSIVSTLQCFMNSYGSYLALRIILGCCEAGFIPASLYILTTYYKSSEISLRMTIFFLGNVLASAFASLIGAGVLMLDGKCGLAGWRWVFIIEGIITFGLGVVFMLLIPPGVENSTPLISLGKWSYFTRRQHHIMVNRLVLDDPGKASGKIRINFGDIRAICRSFNMWLHLLITCGTLMATSSAVTYGPRIIKQMGFTAVKANALFCIAPIIAGIISIILGAISDFTQHRGPSVLLSCVWMLIVFAILQHMGPDTNRWNRYAAIVCGCAINNVPHSINTSWMALNAETPQQRSIGMAFIIMAANLGALAGAQIFREHDAPLYHEAFTIITSLAAFNTAVVGILIGLYFVLNRKSKPKVIDSEASPSTQTKCRTYIY